MQKALTRLKVCEHALNYILNLCNLCLLIEEEVWHVDPSFEIDDDFMNETPPSLSDIDTDNSQSVSKSLCTWIVLFLSHFQVIFYIPDRAMDVLLKFMSAFLFVMGSLSTVCCEVAKYFPQSLYRLKTYTGVHRLISKKYVVCRKCSSVYRYEECVSGHSSKVCSHRKFPNHPHRRHRQQCGTVLLKSVELSTGRRLLYPFLTYCFLGLQCGLQQLLMNQDFVKLSEQWRSRDNNGMLCDVYDGRVWSNFQTVDGHPFLSEPLSFGMILNVDWFLPYKHVKTYHVGAIYMVCMNLPRHIRFKRENVLLIGILPGPHEASHDINSFLRPLVDELSQLWEGVNMTVHGYGTKKLVKCALLCGSCDIPAGRKVFGFLGHSARLGCSRCLKSFLGSFGSMDYSGFDRENWPPRTRAAHVDATRQQKACTSQSRLDALESSSGYKYTVLLDLPYFVPWRMLVVDPMHNLFLGTAKHVLSNIWLEKDIVNTDQFAIIQKRVDGFKIPSDIGRIPYKIGSGFSSFTADQFKNWIVYFSLISMRGILTGAHLECWRHFVLACRILVQFELSHADISLADALLLQFCKRVERLYGKSAVTPNMHLHCHLKECILDFGPTHGFWCFSFERYNGLLGELPNNNRSIEVQVMDRFIRDNALTSHPLPDMFAEKLAHLFPHQKTTGSLLDSTTNTTFCLPVSDYVESSLNGIAKNVEYSLPTVSSKHAFSDSDLTGIKHLYSRLFSVPETSVNVSSTYVQYTTLKINNKQFGSYSSISSNTSIVLALWTPSMFTSESSTGTSEVEKRPVRINFFARHSVIVNDVHHTFISVCVSWFKPHLHKNLYGKPITVWEPDTFENDFCYRIIPIQFIVCRTASLLDEIDGLGHALFVCPCIDF